MFAAAVLTAPDRPLEVQMSAYSLLQFLVRCLCCCAVLVLCAVWVLCCDACVLCAGCCVLRVLTRARTDTRTPNTHPHTTQVVNRWAELSAEEHSQVTQLAYQHLQDGERERERERGEAGAVVGLARAARAVCCAYWGV